VEPEPEPEPEPEAESESEPESEPEPEPEPEAESEPEPEPEAEPEPEPSANGRTADVAAGSDTESEAVTTDEDDATDHPTPEPSGERALVTVDSLRERVGETVRIEGEIVSVRQTSGPTVFELRDETAVVDCAAFVEAGVRAYPDVEVGDIVRLDGEVRVRRDELQMETEGLVVLEGENRETVEGRMADALSAEADTGDVEPVVPDETVAAIAGEIRTVGTAIRRAVKESRPVVVRHSADADGYAAGAAIERAVLPLVREEHPGSDAVYHYFDRRPLEGTVYDLDDATKDVTRMLDGQERHDEKIPLFVFVGAGGTRDSLDAFELLGVYDAERVVVDGTPVDDAVAELVEGVVACEDRTAATVAASVAAAVNEDVRDDLGHLPAISYWNGAPEAYVEAAAEAGLDEAATTQLREAVALEAYYQSYEDKRELIIDLLFEQQHGLAEQVSTQFRTKLGTELDTAVANVEHREAGGVEFTVLDTDAYTHRFDFPPTGLLLDELHRRESEDGAVTVGLGRDELRLRAAAPLDLHAIADRVADQLGDAGVTAKGTRDGTIEFLAGERGRVLEATLEEVAAELSAAPAA
jgi:RecJ-like exonuclease